MPTTCTITRMGNRYRLMNRFLKKLNKWLGKPLIVRFLFSIKNLRLTSFGFFPKRTGSFFITKMESSFISNSIHLGLLRIYLQLKNNFSIHIQK